MNIKKKITPELIIQTIEEEKVYEKILAKIDLPPSTFFYYLNQPGFEEAKQFWKGKSRRNQPYIPPELVVEAMENLYGNMAAVAEYFGVSRRTIFNYVNSDEDIKAAYEQGQESRYDMLHSKLDAQLDSNLTALIFAMNHEEAKRNRKVKEQMLKIGLNEEGEMLTLTAVPKYKD